MQLGGGNAATQRSPARTKASAAQLGHGAGLLGCQGRSDRYQHCAAPSSRPTATTAENPGCDLTRTHSKPTHWGGHGRAHPSSRRGFPNASSAQRQRSVAASSTGRAVALLLPSGISAGEWSEVAGGPAPDPHTPAWLLSVLRSVSCAGLPDRQEAFVPWSARICTHRQTGPERARQKPNPIT